MAGNSFKQYLIIFISFSFIQSQNVLKTIPIIEELGCGNCHSGVNVSTILLNRAPDLSYAGLKYNEAFLFDYLKSPQKIRYNIGNSRMPNFGFSDDEALALTKYLMSRNILPDGTSIQSKSIKSNNNGFDLIHQEYQCTSCHMPFQQHRAVGNEIRFVRADHTISIPRPDLDKTLGITNACSQCHDELSNNQISNQIKSWYGKLKPLHPLESALFSYIDKNDSNSDMIKLIGSNQDPYPQVFAGLAAAFMSDNVMQDSKLYINRLMNLSNNKDLDIKSLALAYLDMMGSTTPLLSTFTIDILSKSGKDQSKIRTRWSIALAYKAQDLSNKGLYYDGIELYKKALTIWPKNNRARRGLASTYLLINDIENAIIVYGEIIKSNKLDWQAWVSLANAQAINEQNEIALEAYMRSLEINTYNSSAHLGIGNVLYKMKNYVLAEKHLIKSIELDQSMTDSYIYLAAIQIQRQDFKRATSYLNRGLILKPDHEIGKMMKDELNKLDE